jgi:hypothetical protein
VPGTIVATRLPSRVTQTVSRSVFRSRKSMFAFVIPGEKTGVIFVW